MPRSAKHSVTGNPGKDIRPPLWGSVTVNQNHEDMMMKHLRRVMPAASVGLGLLGSMANPASSAPYVQTDLVSDIPGLATITEPTLVNPWGISHSATSPFWISDQVQSMTNLWSVTGPTTVTKVTAVNPPTGNIAVTAAGPQGPTGQVANTNTSAFAVSTSSGGNGSSANFIFAGLTGTISAWNGGPTAFTQATTAAASYTGLAINSAQTMLYAANDAGTGSVDVFNSSFTKVTTPGAFATPPAISALGLLPFNVQDIDGQVYVTYAPSGRPAQASAAPGAGAVAIFTESGTFVQTIIGGQFAAPWGVALAPAGFGEFANDLLVGNFSFDNSEINAFDPTTGAFKGFIPVDPGPGNTPGGLWALNFGIGGANGDPNTLYITDGINGEKDGLFAAIEPVPEPSTLALLGAGVLSLCAWRRRRSARPNGGLLNG